MSPLAEEASWGLKPSQESAEVSIGWVARVAFLRWPQSLFWHWSSHGIWVSGHVACGRNLASCWWACGDWFCFGFHCDQRRWRASWKFHAERCPVLEEEGCASGTWRSLLQALPCRCQQEKMHPACAGLVLPNHHGRLDSCLSSWRFCRASICLLQAPADVPRACYPWIGVHDL